jgi:hypothetical protein
MRLSRTDLVPVLTIVAGGILGASLSPGFFGSRSANPVPDYTLGMVAGQVTDAQTGLPVVAAQLYIAHLDRRSLKSGQPVAAERPLPATERASGHVHRDCSSERISNHRRADHCG